MAVVGDAYIVVHAITSGFESEVRRAANGINLNREGANVGDSFSRGMTRNMQRSLIGFEQQALAASKRFQSLVRTGYTIGPILSVAVSTIGSLGSAIVSLGAAVVGAVPSLVVFASALTSIGIAAVTAKAAFSGVGKAISAGLKQQTTGAKRDAQAKVAAQKRVDDALENYLRIVERTNERIVESQDRVNEAYEEAKEQIQQLRFEAEEAAFSERRAAIELERARETLARVQDLPPNSRARREAQLAYEEAEFNLRRAKDRSADLNKENDKLNGTVEEAAKKTDTYKNALEARDDAVRDGIRQQQSAKEALEEAENAQKNAAKGANDYATALNDLSVEAQKFVKYIVTTFQPALRVLRDAAGSQLFGPMIRDLERIRTQVFPQLEPALARVGGSIATAFSSITDAITNIESLEDLDIVFEQSALSIESYGKTIANLYEGFLSILVAAEPIILRFNRFLEATSERWKNALQVGEETGTLTEFFERAGNIAAKLGKIIGNVFGGIVNIVEANFTPGGGGWILLDWLDQVTDRFDTFYKTVEGQQILTTFFKESALNAKSALGAIGALLKEILRAGADPNIRVFWDTLRDAAPILRSLLAQLNASAPAFAKFLISFGNFLELTLTTQAIQVFFTVLRTALDSLNAVLSTKFVKSLFDAGSQIFAFISAIALLGSIGSFAIKVIVGGLLRFAKVISFLKGGAGLAGLKTAIGGVAAAFGVATGPFLLITAAVIGLIAVLKQAWDSSELLRSAVKEMVDILRNVFKGAIEEIKVAFASLTESFGGTFDIFKLIGDFIGERLVPLFGFLLAGAIGTLTGALKGVIYVVKAVIGVFTTIFSLITSIIKLIRGDFKGAFSDFKDFLKGIANIITDVFKGILSPFISTYNAVARFMNEKFKSFSFTIPDWVPKVGGKQFSLPTLPVISERQFANFARFAKGGVVMPQDGGALVRVAEAGKPERIEPLDADGMSKRDREILKMMSNSMKSPTIIINPSEKHDEREIARRVSLIISKNMIPGVA